MSTSSTRTRRTTALGVVAMGVLLAPAALAQDWYVYPGAPDGAGGYVTPMDNPILRGAIPLGPSEYALREADDHWGYSRFELQTFADCPPTDPFCVATFVRGDEGVLNAWPIQVGYWQPGTIVPVEVHGFRLGADAAQLRIDKAARDGTITTAGAVQVRLDPETIIVPVNVVVVEPTADISEYLRSYMQRKWEDVTYYKTLFDDVWSPDLTRITEPGGLLNAIEGDWFARTHRSSLDPSGEFNLVDPPRNYDFVRPDDVFVQCGIQFRLASVVVIDEPDPIAVYWTEPNGDMLCKSVKQFTYYRKWKARAATSPAEVRWGSFNTNGITVALPPYHQEPSCGLKDGTAGLTDSAEKISAIGVLLGKVNDPRLVLAHELGWSLGFSNIPEYHASCPNLMCQGGLTPHIPHCETRDGALLASLPFNCTPGINEENVGGSCDQMRSVARGVAIAAEVPIPMEPDLPPPIPGGVGRSVEWWSSDGLLAFDDSSFTEGTASLEASGSGYRVVESPSFRTADWLKVGNRLSVDVLVRPEQPNPYWLGSLDLFVDVPAAVIYNVPIGHRELTGLEAGVWHTMEFDVGEDVQEAFLGDFPDGLLRIAVNTPWGAPGVLLDNLRFTGELVDRTVTHQGPSSGGTTNPVFSFDNSSDWSSTTADLRAEGTEITQGTASLGVQASGYAEILSRAFDPAELGAVSSVLSVDVFVPTEQPNPYWMGAIQAYATCPAVGIYDAYLGQEDLTFLFRGEFNTVEFPPLPAEVVTAFSTPGQACWFKLALNVNDGSGEHLLDNLAFR